MARRGGAGGRRLAVVALGGNALLRAGEAMSMANQRRNARRAAAAIAEVGRSRELVVTHGNGPQVGALALQGGPPGILADQTLDVLNAESAAMIGYVLEQELARRMTDRPFATLLTMVVVNRDDPALGAPDKPIGPWYDERGRRRVAKEHDWSWTEREGRYRRVVPSPEPCEILELAAVEALLRAGITPICAGGGGVAVTRAAEGGAEGLEAIVDKDLTSALLAEKLGAELLLLLTDVPAVYADWGGARARPAARLDRAAARRLGLPAGSMAPKVEAALRFAEGTGRPAVIGRLEDAARMARGQAGTRVVATSAG